MFDPAAPSRFYFSWHSGYTANTNYPSLAWTDLIPGAPVCHGSWQGDGTTVWTKKIQGGTTIIPDWFANAYLGGRKLGLGFGGYYSIAAGCSFGPFLAAAFHPTDGVPTWTPSTCSITRSATSVLAIPTSTSRPRLAVHPTPLLALGCGTGMIWSSVPAAGSICPTSTGWYHAHARAATSGTSGRQQLERSDTYFNCL